MVSFALIRDADQGGWQAGVTHWIFSWIRVMQPTSFLCIPVSGISSTDKLYRASLLDARLIARRTLSQLARTHATARNKLVGLLQLRGEKAHRETDLRCRPSRCQSCSQAPAFAWRESRSNLGADGDSLTRLFWQQCAWKELTKAGADECHQEAWKLDATSRPFLPVWIKLRDSF